MIKRIFVTMLAILLLLLLIFNIYTIYKPAIRYKDIYYSKNLSLLILNRMKYTSSTDPLEKLKEFIILDYKSKSFRENIDKDKIKTGVDELKSDIDFINSLKEKNIKFSDDDLTYFITTTLAIEKLNKKEKSYFEKAQKVVGIYEIVCNDESQQELVFKKISNNYPILELAKELAITTYPKYITDKDKYFNENIEVFKDVFTKKIGEVFKAEVSIKGKKNLIVYKISDSYSDELLKKINEINQDDSEIKNFNEAVKNEMKNIKIDNNLFK